MKSVIVMFGIAAVMFAQVMALALDSVGVYQLNAAYFCSVEATEIQHDMQCRNELDGFGSYLVLPPIGQTYLAHKIEMHK